MRGIDRAAIFLVLLIAAAVVTTAQTSDLRPLPEVHSKYSMWLEQDVRWIIKDHERRAFLTLKDDEEREHFIEEFWLEKDPTRETLRNEFKETHYQRLLAARQLFSDQNEPGWNTPQGRIYVLYGAPNSIEKQATLPKASERLLSSCDSPRSRSSTDTTGWRYSDVQGTGHPLTVFFSDVCGDGHSVAIVSEADRQWQKQQGSPRFVTVCQGRI